MGSKLLGAILVVLGVALVLLSVFAESLGVGVSSGGVEGAPTSPAFGWKQWLGLVLGAVLALAGIAALLRGGPVARGRT